MFRGSWGIEHRFRYIRANSVFHFLRAFHFFSARHEHTLIMYSKIALASILFGAARAQQIGTVNAETHPSLTWEKCTAPGSCTSVSGKVVLDSNWRWVHDSASGRLVEVPISSKYGSLRGSIATPTATQATHGTRLFAQMMPHALRTVRSMALTILVPTERRHLAAH